MFATKESVLYHLKGAFSTFGQREHTMSWRFEDEENKLKASCKHHWSSSTQWSQWWSIGAVWPSRAALLTACVRHCTVVIRQNVYWVVCSKLLQPGPALIEQTNGLWSGLAHTRPARYIGHKKHLNYLRSRIQAQICMKTKHAKQIH